jgi:adenylate cyclase
LQSALLIRQRVQQLKSRGAGMDLAGFDVKVGISSGRAIVGNVGAPRRLSYTALGATVNLASRLEKVCTAFGCTIVVDAATMAALSDRYLFCELDAVALKGKRNPVAVYEAIAPIESATPEQRDYVARYQAALQCYRTGDVNRAAALWLELAAISRRGSGVSPPSVMAQRARTGEPVLAVLAIG